ncbi:MAG: MFS transporter [Candidatus Omnitrophica bacterium]|nr:MFS transporter [Candidatus Omnitrophota bacterium]
MLLVLNGAGYTVFSESIRMIHFREVLFKKNFFVLWLGQIISEFGDRLNQMALIALVYSKNPGSVMALAKVLFFVVVPVFVIGPIAGVYVDRWNRKKVMIISDVVRGTLVFTIPIFVYFKLMVPVYIAVFLIFSATRFFLPSKMALIPEIVPKEKLMVANSLSNTTRMIATILGFAVAGFIVKWIGYIWGFYLDSVSYFVSAVLIAIITPRKKTRDIKKGIQATKSLIEKAIRRNVWNEIVEGFKYMFEKDKMKVVVSALFLLMAGTGSIFCIIIVFVQEAFGSVTGVLGSFGVFLGFGLFGGTVLYGKYGQKLSHISTIFVCFALSGALIGIFAFCAGENPVFIIGALLIMMVGMTAAPIFTCTNTLIHLLVPDNVRGRIFSSIEALMHFLFLCLCLLPRIFPSM